MINKSCAPFYGRSNEMRQMIKIGDKEFKFKKDALKYYKEILNSYNFGEILTDNHYNDIIDLLNYVC